VIVATVLQIRCAAPAEREALGELHRRSSYVWDEDRVHLEAHPDALGVAAKAISDGRVRVAVNDADELLGFSVVGQHPAGGVCELEDLFVDPDAMRRGVGRALVEDGAKRALLAGCREMTVVAHPRNFAFYESVGFAAGEPVSTRFGPATRLRRRLAAAGA
jgi:ribosomal protein S18 acetylase RimI-like enzyme